MEGRRRKKRTIKSKQKTMIAFRHIEVQGVRRIEVHVSLV